MATGYRIVKLLAAAKLTAQLEPWAWNRWCPKGSRQSHPRNCDLPDVNRSDVNYGYWVHFSAIKPLINLVVLLCCKDLKSMLGPRVFSYHGCSLTDDYADAGCLPNACIYYSRKGRKLREGFARQPVSPTLRSIRDYFLLLSILVPIICPWVLRILYNTGISCCEKAGRWQLAATTLAAIIEETASPKSVHVPYPLYDIQQHNTRQCLDVCRSVWQMRLATMLLSVLARRVENGNGCLGLHKASHSGSQDLRWWSVDDLSPETWMFAQGGNKMQ